MIPTGFLDGIPVICTDAITKTVRKRRHRKKRIDKKWLKRYGYKEVTDHSKVLMANNMLFMSKECHERLTAAYRKRSGGNVYE